MDGRHTNLVEAMLLKMDTMCIECEKKFVRQLTGILGMLESYSLNKRLGKTIGIQSDAKKVHDCCS